MSARRFEELVARAVRGDAKAVAELPEVARRFLRSGGSEERSPEELDVRAEMSLQVAHVAVHGAMEACREAGRDRDYADCEHALKCLPGGGT